MFAVIFPIDENLRRISFLFMTISINSCDLISQKEVQLSAAFFNHQLRYGKFPRVRSVKRNLVLSVRELFLNGVTSKNLIKYYLGQSLINSRCVCHFILEQLLELHLAIV